MFILMAIIGWSNDDFEKLKNGDTAMLEKLYIDYKSNIFRFIFLKTRGNKELAEDIFSETFHSALSSVGTLKNNTNIRSWLIKIAHRRYIDFVRKNTRDEKINNMLIMTHTEYQEDTSPGIVIEQEKELAFNCAMENLKDMYKQVLTLKYIEKKSVLEISTIIMKNERETEGLLYRARNTLKKEIKSIMER